MKRLVFFGSVITLFFLGSCKKSEDVKVHVPGYLNNANDLVQKFGPQRQYFSMSTTELPQELTLTSGTVVKVPANAIQKNGDYVAGNLVVEVYEFMKRSDIILGGVNTNHYDGSPIESKGMMFINILSNNRSTDLTLKNLMDVSMPSGQGGYIKICGGDLNAYGTGQLAWGPQMIDSINSDGSRYNFKTMSIGWLNCGSYYKHDDPKGTLTVTLNNNPGAMATSRGATGNTFVYFCPKNSSVTMELYTSAGTDMVKTMDNVIPIGMEGKLIAFSVKDNKFYYAESTITTAQSNMESLTLAETEVTTLLSKINALNTY
jgi:hypothetical protein